LKQTPHQTMGCFSFKALPSSMEGSQRVGEMRLPELSDYVTIAVNVIKRVFLFKSLASGVTASLGRAIAVSHPLAPSQFGRENRWLRADIRPWVTRRINPPL